METEKVPRNNVGGDVVKQKTHLKASKRLVGVPVYIGSGTAEVMLKTTQDMIVDEYGLVHGGFTFGVADYAAMLAVNEPTVVLGKADVVFLKPVALGETLRAKAVVEKVKGKKRIVNVSVSTERGEVFKGTFTCYVLDKHVLSVPR